MNERIENETELIQTYLAPLAAGCAGAFGLADDAAVLALPPHSELVVSTDPIIAGIHFLPTDRADDVAWKALAVNVSDLAAKAATPFAYTMALAFPAAPEKAWMTQFARGLAEAQAAFGCALVGGDTDRTSGPLSISITGLASVPEGKAVRRMTASIGDAVFVTGTLGDSSIGLALHRDAALLADELSRGDRGYLTARYLRPSPRLKLTAVLRDHASAALDISDGLAKDLARLVAGPAGGADVDFARLPLSASARNVVKLDQGWRQSVISGGDDYELLFSVPQAKREEVVAACEGLGVKVTHVGDISPTPGVRIHDGERGLLSTGAGGYDHFA